MSRFIKRQNNLRKAQAKFEKASRRFKQFKIRFERSQNSRGRFRTRADIVRDENTFHGSNRGLAHKVFNLKNRIEGDIPSITKTINSFQPKTFKGKFLKKSAQATNFIIHDTAQTTVDTVLASETIGLKSADAVKREIVNHLKQKYSREAVDDYHRGTLETIRIGADAVKGTHKHFKQKKQYRLEKAKFKLKKAEYAVFKEDNFKPKMQSNKADLKSSKAEFKQHKRNFRNSSQSNIQRAFLIRRKQDFKQTKSEVEFDSKKLKSENKFKRNELKNQRKIKDNSKTGFLVLKPASYTANRMKASAWQKAVNEDSDNDMLHALDSTKRRITEPVIQKVSKLERLQRQQKKRDNLSDKEKKKKKRLNKQENRLKTKNRQPPKKRKKTKLKKSFSEKFKDFGKLLKQFIKNVYEREVKKFFVCVAVSIIIILLVFALILMLFSSTGSGGSFTLATYTAQDYDLSEAEKYYTKLAWDLNEKVIRCGGDDWKKALKDLGADTSDYKDKPDEYIWGRSVHFDYDAVYDFDVNKLWSFLCAYYYDFDAENGDLKYWKFNDSTENLLNEIFNAEYEFQHYYDNTSHWEEYFSYTFEGGIDGTYWLADSENMYADCFLPKGNPGELDSFKDNNGYLHFNEYLEILNAQDDYKRTGWFIQDQRYFVNDRSGQSSEPFYSWFNGVEFGRIYGEDYHPRSYWGFSDTDQIYWCVSPQDTWYWRNDLIDTCLISYYHADYWKNDCRLYYNVKQKKTFDEVINDKLSSMSHSDERVQYYNLLAGTDSGILHGNHQTLRSLTGTSIHDSTITNGFGWDMQEWNIRHCSIDDLHDAVDIAVESESSIYAPFKCRIKSYDSDKKTVILRKDDVEYWYDGTGGTKRDTEVTIKNVTLNGCESGDTLNEGDIFALASSTYIHIRTEIDTDGIGWDFIDPRLVFY